MLSSKQYTVEGKGIVHIMQFQKSKSKTAWNIWWDFYEEHFDQILIEPEAEIWYDDCGVDNFKDAPRGGEFSSFKAACEYATEKIGELK